ncbi:MAG: hypothetical protein ACRBN8_46865 [Nannocystales bacterium]
MGEDDEDGEVRDVYAHFGLALYMAQVLEHGLVNTMLFLRARGASRMEEAEIDAFYNRHFRRTLGQLVRGLSEYAEVPEGLVGVLRDALQKRNWLAHSYFRERSKDFMTGDGRTSMIQELQSARDQIHDADQRLESFLGPIRRRLGLTDEMLEEEYCRMRAELGAGG